MKMTFLTNKLPFTEGRTAEISETVFSEVVDRVNLLEVRESHEEEDVFEDESNTIHINTQSVPAFSF